MRYGPKEITVNGRVLTLRSPAPEDAAAMLAYLRDIYGETEFMVSYPDEVVYTEEEEVRLFRRWSEAAAEIMIAVFDEARIVGTVNLAAVGIKSKVRHRTGLGISLRREVWGFGLGRFLMREAEAAARTMGFTQIELGVFSDNVRAIHLYETEGYRVYGRVPDAFHLRDGAYRDELLMAKSLAERE